MKKKTLAKSYWTHKKFPNRKFTGEYVRDDDGERYFDLKSELRNITFESWQMAKKLGWKRKKAKAGRK